MTHTQEWLAAKIALRAHDAIVFANTQGVIGLWNAGAEAMFGYTAAEALGKTLDIIIPERSRPRHWEAFHAAMARGTTKYTTELLAVPALRKDGTRISLEFSILLLRDEAGAPLGVGAIIRDVTARRQQDRELRDRLAALEARAPEPERPGG